MEQQYSKLFETIQAVIKAYEKWDIEAIMALRTPGCLYHTLPKSMNRPPMNNDDFRAYFAGILPYFKNFKVTIHDMLVDTRKNKVAMYITSTADSVTGLYNSERTVIFQMTDDGNQISEMKEFFDTAQLQGVFAELAKYKAEGGKPIAEM